MPEVEWDEQQQAHMLALAEYRAALCPNCGGYLPDTTAPEADGDYVCDLPYECQKCVALDIAAKDYRDEPHAGALLFVAKRRG